MPVKYGDVSLAENIFGVLISGVQRTVPVFLILILETNLLQSVFSPFLLCRLAFIEIWLYSSKHLITVQSAVL